MATVRHLGLFPFACVAELEDVAFQIEGGRQREIYIEMPPLQATAIYWIVKTWRVRTYVGPYDINTGTYAPLQLKYETLMQRRAQDFFGSDTLIFTSEQELVCRQGARLQSVPTYGAFFYGDDEYTFLDFTADVNPLASEEVEGMSEMVMQKDGGNLFPIFRAGDIFGGTGVVPEDVLSYAESDGIAPTGTTTCDLKDFGTIVWGSYPTINAIAMPTKIEIIAEEFWEYDPGDGGGPIYDSTTGAQLRAFP
jgi:hypothetical protein